MTLDERIERDLTELYEGKEISCAKNLQAVIEISAKGLPQHFVGDRNAKTVFVQLNPGQDVKKADDDFNTVTAEYDRKMPLRLLKTTSVQKLILEMKTKKERTALMKSRLLF